MALTPDPVKDFIKKLETIDRSRRISEKFRDLMELGYCAFAKLTATTPERADVLEARYMDIVHRYEDKDAIRAYPELIGIAWNAVKDGRCDFLGTVSSQLEILDARQGQFFTPYTVAQMMARITLNGMDAIIARDGYITVHEPASGAGGMLLAYADALQEAGYDPGQHLLVNAVDVSAMCYHMCYLQLTWRGIPGLVERKNTLTLEQWESAFTPPTAAFIEQHGRLFNKPPVPTQVPLFLFDVMEEP